MSGVNMTVSNSDDYFDLKKQIIKHIIYEGKDSIYGYRTFKAKFYLRLEDEMEREKVKQILINTFREQVVERNFRDIPQETFFLPEGFEKLDETGEMGTQIREVYISENVSFASMCDPQTMEELNAFATSISFNIKLICVMEDLGLFNSPDVIAIYAGMPKYNRNDLAYELYSIMGNYKCDELIKKFFESKGDSYIVELKEYIRYTFTDFLKGDTPHTDKQREEVNADMTIQRLAAAVSNYKFSFDVRAKAAHLCGIYKLGVLGSCNSLKKELEAADITSEMKAKYLKVVEAGRELMLKSEFGNQ